LVPLTVEDQLDEIKEKIWAHYSCRLQDLLQEQLQSSRADDDNGLTTSTDRPVLTTSSKPDPAAGAALFPTVNRRAN